MSEALEGALLSTERRKYVLVACVVAAVVLLDQASKQWVASTLALHPSKPIVEGFFHITYVRNTGAAFSLLAGKSAAFRVPFFALVSLVAGFALVTFVRRTPASQRLVLVACGAVLGGAVGNLVDRLRYGEVIDFLDLHWRAYYWPAFNVADSCISVGVIFLLISSLATASDDDRSR